MITPMAAKRENNLYPAVSLYSPQPDKRHIPQNSHSSLPLVFSGAPCAHYSGHLSDSSAVHHFVAPAHEGALGGNEAQLPVDRGSTDLGEMSERIGRLPGTPEIAEPHRPLTRTARRPMRAPPGPLGCPTESVAFVRSTAATTEAAPTNHPDDVQFVTIRPRKITPNTLRNPFSWIR
ncbi:hypothetical protein [Actinomadura formosensis]|uniref:hypothetical protein n=1 Tax=Actinomadura formosensis TaxID=60706 RepID=UPI00104133CB|nr:hypothetical protein [Actinomadura formosensis]